jgi:hypothetical protein
MAARPVLGGTVVSKDGIRNRVDGFMLPGNQNRPAALLGSSDEFRFLSFAEVQIEIKIQKLSQRCNRLLGTPALRVAGVRVVRCGGGKNECRPCEQRVLQGAAGRRE